MLAILVGVSRDVLVGAFIGITSTVIIYITVPKLTIITTIITKYESIEKVITSKFLEAKNSKV